MAVPLRAIDGGQSTPALEAIQQRCAQIAAETRSDPGLQKHLAQLDAVSDRIRESERRRPPSVQSRRRNPNLEAAKDL